MTRARADIAATCLLAFIPLALYARCLVPGAAFLDEDLFAIHLALRSQLLGDAPSGDWNPYLFGGFPFTADPHAAAWYPPHRLLGLLVADPARHLTWSTALHAALATVGAYVFLRRRSTTAGAAAGALVWGCNGFAMAHAVHPGWSAALAWTGWLLYALDRARTDRAWLLAAVPVVALVAVAGNPQGALVVFGLAAVWTLLGAASSPRAHASRAARVAHVVLVGAAGLLGVLLAAPQLVPTAELAAHSFRTLPGLLSPQHADLGYLARLLAPLADGPPQAYAGPSTFVETTFFTGAAPWLIVVAGLSGLGRRERVALAFTAVLGLWLTTGVLGAASLLPPGFRAHERYFPLAAGALAYAVARTLPHVRLRRATVLAAALLAAAAFLAAGATPSREAWVAFAVAAVVCGVAALLPRHPVTTWLAVAVVTAELGAFGVRLTVPTELAPLRASLARIQSALPPGSRALVSGERAEPWLNAGGVIERAMVRGYHPLAPARVVALLGATRPSGDTPHLTPWPSPDAPHYRRLLDVFAVDAVLSLDGPAAEARLRSRSPARIVRRSGVIPALAASDLAGLVLASDAVVIETEPLPAAAPGDDARPVPPVAWAPCGPDCFEATWPQRGEDLGATYLLAPLPPYPGWQARDANGTAQPVLPANLVASAVPLAGDLAPPVRFTFHSPTVELGRHLGLAAALVWFLLAALSLAPRLRRRPPRRYPPGATR
jgi:hypothetical protein